MMQKSTIRMWIHLVQFLLLLNICSICAVSSLNNTNTTDFNVSTTAIPTTTPLPTPITAEEKEKNGSMTIFFVLSVLGLCICAIHVLIKTKFAYLPESVAVVVLGAMLGGLIKLLQKYNLGNWEKEELFDPTLFFLVLLPPIIFESGYNLHKGNFFANLGSIVVFAVIGTIISSIVVGAGIYLLGLAKIAHPLTLRESFAFGSLISAVDPVATLAIFHALDVDPLLNMLVFGESILNDAVAIVLTKSVLKANTLMASIGEFIKIFLGSSAIGVAFASFSALILKHIDLRMHPSLELGMMIIFSYAPYELAEGLQLSGIMAILFCGIVMSHYTHFNLSPVTQITVQHLFRTAAFVSETCVFAYLGMSIFSFDHKFETSFIVWSIILILLGRALNVFPLATVLNYFRETKIKSRNQLVMWFSGLRGAIAFALAINLDHNSFSEDKRRLLITATLVIVLFTLLVLGGSTLPLLKLLNATHPQQSLTLSKTEAEGSAVDAATDDERRISKKMSLRGFTKLDAKYFIPFFTRKITREELRNAHQEMQKLTSQWYAEVQNSTDEEEIQYSRTSNSAL